MASAKALEALFNEGKLGELLVQAFGGTRGRVEDGNKDSDFLIVFESEAKTPSAEAIAKTVTEHYWTLGYDIEKVDTRNDCFEAFISYGRHRMNACVVGVIITALYPYEIGANRASLRATCSFHAKPS